MGNGHATEDAPRRSAGMDDKAFKMMAKGLTMCVAYSANIGGTATLTGTGPNLIVKGQLDTYV